MYRFLGPHVSLWVVALVEYVTLDYSSRTLIRPVVQVRLAYVGCLLFYINNVIWFESINQYTIIAFLHMYPTPSDP